MSAATLAAPAHVWESSSLLDFDGTPAERFMRVIESIPPRTRFTANDIRDRLDTAAVPNKLRGGLMSAAAAAGLIEAVTVAAWGTDYDVRVRSTGASAKRATVRVYRRLGEEPAGGGT